MMKKKFVLIVACLIVGMQLNAQGIVVNKTDGTHVYYSADQLESITTFGYGDETLSFTVGGVSFNMVKVEAGSFKMGSNDSDANLNEKPVHTVTFAHDYFIARTEVTQELWEAVMGNNPSAFKGAKKPVEKVSWDDCQTFIDKLNEMTGQHFRLPTEAEWEFAARGGNKSLGYKYSGSDNIDEVAWFTENSGNETHPVGTKQPNELGIFDMSGNVWEWCADWYGDYSASAQKDPKGPSQGSCRVLRGGSWFDSTGFCRVSRRLFNTPDYRGRSNGLRLAL